MPLAVSVVDDPLHTLVDAAVRYTIDRYHNSRKRIPHRTGDHNTGIGTAGRYKIRTAGGAGNIGSALQPLIRRPSGAPLTDRFPPLQK